MVCGLCQGNLPLTKVIEIIGSGHRKDFKKGFKPGCTILNTCLCSVFPNTLVQVIPRVWREGPQPAQAFVAALRFVTEKILPALLLLCFAC